MQNDKLRLRVRKNVLLGVLAMACKALFKAGQGTECGSRPFEEGSAALCHSSCNQCSTGAMAREWLMFGETHLRVAIICCAICWAFSTRALTR